MSPDSAARICVLFYLAMIVGVFVLGYLVHWMASTYAAAKSTVARGVAIVTYTATPFFVAGLFGLQPSLWFDIAVGVIVACYCVYLLYLGVPIVMDIPAGAGLSVRQRRDRDRPRRHRCDDGRHRPAVGLRRRAPLHVLSRRPCCSNRGGEMS